MDPVSHALVGAVIGSLAAPGQETAVLVSTIAGAVMPDADFAIRVVGGRRAYLKYHRGFSHSPLAGLVMAATIGLLVSRLLPGVSSSAAAQMAVWALLGFLSHILLDLTNAYGTQALWPWQQTRYAWDWTAIVDVPLVVLAAGGWAGALFFPATGRILPALTLLMMVAYLAMRASIHRRLLAAVRQRYQTAGAEKVSVLPGLVGWNRWRYVVDVPGATFVGTASWRPFRVEPARRLARAADQAVQASTVAPSVQALQQFARHPVVDWRREGNMYVVRWYDVRYVDMGYAPFAAVVTLDRDFDLIDDRFGGIRLQ